MTKIPYRIQVVGEELIIRHTYVHEPTMENIADIMARLARGEQVTVDGSLMGQIRTLLASMIGGTDERA